MATQRRGFNSGDKTAKDAASIEQSKSNITPAVPTYEALEHLPERPVIAKLLGFTFAMITMPIGGYFLSRDILFSGNTTWAGATAAVIANVVLIGYVLVAFAEDKSERAMKEAKKTR